MPELKKLRVAAVGLVFFAHSSAFSGSLCPKVAPAPPQAQTEEGERWSIRESDITEAAARRELRKIEKLMGPDGFGVGADTLDTAYVYIKGWFLKNQALIADKRKEPLGTYASDFCAFLTEEAYVRH